MSDVEQHPHSRKTNSRTKRDAPRQLGSFPFTAERHIERYAYLPRLPGKWITVGCNAEACKHIAAYHVGNKAGCSAIEKAYSLGCSCCINKGSYGNLPEFDFRQALFHRGGHSWAQVGRIIDKMLACGIMRRAPHAPHIFQFRHYNDKPLKVQKKHQAINPRPVSERNKQVAYSSMESGTYEEVETLMNARDAQADGIDTQASAFSALEVFSKEIKKNSLPIPSLATHDGIGPSILPAAEQGLAATQRTALAACSAEPAQPPNPQEQPDRTPKEQDKPSELAVKLSRLVAQGFKIPTTLAESVAARADEPLPQLTSERVSEAWCRGFTRMQKAEAWQAKGQNVKRRRLVPVRETTASFLRIWHL